MANHEELPLADQDNGAGQQGTQSNSDEGILGREQTSLPEEERQGDQFENSQADQDVFSDQESPQAMIGLQEPGMQSPDEMGTLPEGRGEPIDSTMEQVDQETFDRLPADQLEREVVPVTLEGPQ